ncbi:MAG: carboxypeptidase regulatory-like domain-containing protein [Terriglobia bacterium]
MRRGMLRISVVLVVLSIGAIWGAALFGQAITSSITGTVSDSSGAVVPGATVTVSDRSLGVTRVTTTNSTGSYLVSAIPPGTYDLTVSSHGFKTYRATGVVIQAATKIRANATLQIGAVSTQVTVQGTNIGQVQTQTSEIGGTITGRQITQLELNGRNFTQLITLVPGVMNMTGQEEGTVGVSGSVAYSINGGRTEYNNWEVNGVSILDGGSNGTINVYPSVDAIAETRVLTSNYPAQYGQNASGTIVAVTKSGTNQFHGDAYEFNRNEIFNARSFTDTGRPAYKKNDYGYTLGGPFYIPGHYNTDKTKTFFFWSQEWRKETNPSSFDNQVPSTQERTGDFSDVCPTPANGSTPASFVDCPTNPVTGAYFPGNQVPIDPNAQAEMAMIPAPNSGSGATSFYVANPSYPTDWRQELVTVDQNITPKVRMMVNYIHDTWSTVEATSLWSNGSSFPTINTDFAGPGTAFVTQLTASLSPTLLNEFIFGYTADHIILSDKGAWQRPAGMTMTGLFNNGFGGKLTGFTLGNNTAYGGGFSEDPSFINPASPVYNSNPIYTFRDMVTKIYGNHNLTFGADFIAYQKNEQNGISSPNTEGILNFSSTASAVTTGNGFADMLLGRISSFSQLNSELKYYNRYKTLGPYIQDDWHVSRRLTLNLGFRAELMGTFYSKLPNEYSFRQQSYNPANAPEIDVTGSITGQAGALVPGVGSPFDGIVQCGGNGVPKSCMKGHLFNPSPRLGFAWDPFGHGTTAIRGGYAIFFDRTNGNEANTESLEGTAPGALSPTQYNIVGYTNIGGGGLLFPLGLTAIEPQMIWPYVQQWNLNVQHNIGKNTVVSVAYVGSKGTHLTDQRDLNQLQPIPASQNPFAPGQPITQNICNNLTVDGTPAGAPVTGQALTNLNIACGNVGPDPFRPITGYGNITMLETQANSNYNSLQVYARKTVGRAQFSVAYTYSHALDDSSDRYDGTFVNSYDLEQNYATSNNDETHILNFSYMYDLPALQHSNALVRDVVGGWELSGITSIHSGTPFSVTNGVFGDTAGVANGTGSGTYADVCGNPHAAPPSFVNPGIGVGPTLLNPSAFCAPTALTFGTGSRNLFRNPTQTDWDMGLFKDIPIHGERAHLQFRAEAFNIFNTVRWTGTNSGVSCYGGTNNSAGDPSCLGTYDLFNPSGAGLGRIFQFGMKVIF